MAIVLDLVTDPSSGESYDIVTVKNIKEGYIVHIYPLNFNVEWGKSIQGEKFLNFEAQTQVALTKGVQNLIDRGILQII